MPLNPTTLYWARKFYVVVFAEICDKNFYFLSFSDDSSENITISSASSELFVLNSLVVGIDLLQRLSPLSIELADENETKNCKDIILTLSDYAYADAFNNWYNMTNQNTENSELSSASRMHCNYIVFLGDSVTTYDLQQKKNNQLRMLVPSSLISLMKNDTEQYTN